MGNHMNMVSLLKSFKRKRIQICKTAWISCLLCSFQLILCHLEIQLKICYNIWDPLSHYQFNAKMVATYVIGVIFINLLIIFLTEGFKLGSEKHTTEVVVQKSGSLKMISGIEGLALLKTTKVNLFLFTHITWISSEVVASQKSVGLYFFCMMLIWCLKIDLRVETLQK